MKNVFLVLVMLALASIACMQSALPVSKILTVENTSTPTVYKNQPTFRINSATPRPQTKAIATKETTCLEVTAETLNVRTMPGTDQIPVIRILRNGQKVKGYYQSGDWWYISPGWIHGAFVKECEK